jgi:hypothetical protein
MVHVPLLFLAFKDVMMCLVCWRAFWQWSDYNLAAAPNGLLLAKWWAFRHIKNILVEFRHLCNSSWIEL